MKILVTGTAGFIGYHLATRLLERGDTVIGLDCINDYYDIRIKHDRLRHHGIEVANLQPNILTQSTTQPNYQFIQCRLEDAQILNQLIESERPDTVVNLAAQAGVRYSLINPDAYIQSNIVGFSNLLEACRHYKVGHLVYASSSSVYGLNASLPFNTRDNVDHPVSLYAATKKSNELMAHTYSHLFGLPTTGLRFFTVYGPWGRPDMALFLFTKAMLAGEPIEIFNHGKMVRDFTYIDDIIEGVVRVIDQPPKGNPQWDGMHPDPSSSPAPYKVYNIGNNNPVALMDFIQAIETSLGIEAKKNYKDIQPGDVPSTYADVQDLENELGYKPATEVQEGIDRFIQWYRDYFKV
jgi:UDP-glucuronate 4-epimerase